jgi:hypothetical protein
LLDGHNESVEEENEELIALNRLGEHPPLIAGPDNDYTVSYELVLGQPPLVGQVDLTTAESSSCAVVCPLDVARCTHP